MNTDATVTCPDPTRGGLRCRQVQYGPAIQSMGVYDRLAHRSRIVRQIAGTRRGAAISGVSGGVTSLRHEAVARMLPGTALVFETRPDTGTGMAPT